MKRRTFIGSSLAAAVVLPTSGEALHRDVAPVEGMYLGFSTYGMPGLTPEQAIDEVAKAGFDSIEIDSAKGKPAEPQRCSKNL